ncbi:MAG: pectate lyase [Limnochordia bacterium]
MPSVQKVAVSVILTAVLISFLGYNSLAQESAVSAARLLFTDRFAEDQFGDPPAGWTIHAGAGHVTVVPAAELNTGRAVRITSDPKLNNTSISAPLSDPPAHEAKTIVIEHRIRSSQEKNNMYISKAGSHRLHWWVAADHLYFNQGVGAQRSAVMLGKLQEGWNRIRLVADIEKQEVVFHLNDMQVPLSEPLTFGRAIDSWAGAELVFAQSQAVKGEFVYGDVKVWSLGPNAEEDLRRRAEQAGPIWIEYSDVAQRPPEWWKTDEAQFLAERIVHRMKSDEITIDIPLAALTVPDGILATQLSVLAHIYATTGAPRYKEAFGKGLDTLLKAQYASGGWPTVYPKYKNRDLHLDMYAQATWSAIPSLLGDISNQRPPFDTDIISALDYSALETAMARIPTKESIKRFRYADYASRSPSWWQSEEAVYIGDNLLTWQLPSGGWFRDEAWAVLPYSPGNMTRTGAALGEIERGRPGRNGTLNPMRFLARVYEATGEQRYVEGFYRGLDYLLAAQYPSGGWPNDFPDPKGNGIYVTFNDDAMAEVMHFIQDILQGRPPFGSITDVYKARLDQAYMKAVDFILKAQIEVDGRLTAWGQQHDPFSYEPRPYRVFEPAAISGGESVGIVQLLQSIPDPSPEVSQAILCALEWLEEVRLPDDRWARFYEIGTNRPIFVGRDGIIRYDISEIDQERQSGYAWYGTWGATLLARARTGGYMDMLYERLPEHPTVRMRFGSPREGAKVSGVIPLEISLLHAAHEAALTKVTIDIDGNILYEGTELPQPDELEIDTRTLEEGPHTVTVGVIHQEWGPFRQSLKIVVENLWELVQDMRPPATYAWFGLSETFDYLDTASRSEGWIYATDQPELFFGDRERLVRATDASEYLIWETPHLRDATITLYAHPNTPIEKGLFLEVSACGDQWQRVPYSQLRTKDSAEWDRLEIELFLDRDDSTWNQFRLTLSDAIAKEAVQIGKVVFTGYNY